MATDGAPPNSSDAVKTFVNANIQITPATANNPVGTNHVLTITVAALGGNIDAGPAHARPRRSRADPAHSSARRPAPTRAAAPPRAARSTISSGTPGTTVVSATSSIPVSGVSISRTTNTAVNTAAGGSGDASKNWSDDTVTTQVHDPAHNDITGTSVTGGTIVHDQATVAKAADTPAGIPAPTGSVTFTLYDNGTCNGNVLATDPNVPLGTGIGDVHDAEHGWHVQLPRPLQRRRQLPGARRGLRTIQRPGAAHGSDHADECRLL